MSGHHPGRGYRCGIVNANEICKLDVDVVGGVWMYTDCNGVHAFGNVDSLSNTDKGVKAQDKEDGGWSFKFAGKTSTGIGKCSFKDDGEEVFKFEGDYSFIPNTDCTCL